MARDNYRQQEREQYINNKTRNIILIIKWEI